jgi:beta-phosphoglucomutase-like phosphatase (HAD superfamily)
LEISLKPVLRAVIFDLDGVVTDTTRYHFQAWWRLGEEHGCWHVEEELNEKLKGVGRMESLDIILKENAIDLPVSQKIKLVERKNLYYKEFLTRLTLEDILLGMKSH